MVEWENLVFESVDDVWSEKFQAYYAVPTFTESVKKLEGKQVEIEGIITCIDVVDGMYILTLNGDFGFSCCFNPNFGPDGVIEVEFEEVRLKKQAKVRVTGTFRLNSDDIYKLNYTIVNARYEIIKE